MTKNWTDSCEGWSCQMWRMITRGGTFRLSLMTIGGTNGTDDEEN